jgi:hypothetical protein
MSRSDKPGKRQGKNKLLPFAFAAAVAMISAQHDWLTSALSVTQGNPERPSKSG